MATSQAKVCCAWHPFPAAAGDIRAQLSLAQLFLRPFGILAEDLEVDFSPKPPFVATDVIQRCSRNECGEKVEADLLWALPVGKRMQCLLTLCRLSQGNIFSFQFSCANARCGQLMELDIPLAQFMEVRQAADTKDSVTVKWNGEKLRLRKPTGQDQREWLQHAYADESAATHAMVQQLLVSEQDGPATSPGHLPADLLAEISRALDAADPLMNYQCSVVCPYCDHRADYPIDLEAFALKQLQQVQHNLLNNVHCLASAYHWSEAQIFSVPPWRRALYLKRIEMERS